MAFSSKEVIIVIEKINLDDNLFFGTFYFRIFPKSIILVRKTWLRVSFSGDIQNQPDHNPVHPALCEPAFIREFRLDDLHNPSYPVILWIHVN